jgi:hypothetical protein
MVKIVSSGRDGTQQVLGQTGWRFYKVKKCILANWKYVIMNYTTQWYSKIEMN